MNIVCLTNQYPPNTWGGMGIVVDFFARRLSKEHRIFVYTTNSGVLPAFEKDGNLTIYRPIRRFLRKMLQRKKTNGSYTFFHKCIKVIDLFFNNLDCYFLIRGNYREDQYQLVVVHDFMHSLAGLLCQITLGLPVVFHVHFVEFTMTKWGRSQDPFRIIKFFEKKLADYSKFIVVATEEMKDILVRHRWQEQKIKVIPLCNVRGELENLNSDEIGLETQERAVVKELGLRPSDEIVLYVGRLTFLKGVFYLIQAAEYMVAEDPNIKLVLVGEGNPYELNELIRKAKLGRNVYCYNRFLDYREVLVHYKLADICIFPSIQEPFGLVALEAMSLGKPVILGSGFSKVFEGDKKNVSAIYVNPFDPRHMARETLNLLSDEEKRAKMGLSAKEYTHNRFKTEVVINDILKVYADAINM